MKISKADKKAHKAEKKAARKAEAKAAKKAEKKAAKSTIASSAGSAPAFLHSGTAIPTGVNEASDVCALPGDGFLAVSDIHSVAGRVDLQGGQSPVPLSDLPGAESGLEGVTHNAARNLLVVSREEQRQLNVYDWDGLGSAAPELVRVVDVPLGGKVNKGVEGLASLPASLSPTGKDQLLLVKEADPHLLGMLEADGTGALEVIELDPRASQACTDFSGVSVDPKTGNVWICSDETARAVELKLVKTERGLRAELASAPLDLVDAKGKKLKRVEGIAFSTAGDLFVLTENEKALHQYKRNTAVV